MLGTQKNLRLKLLHREPGRPEREFWNIFGKRVRTEQLTSS
jgi:hypothetical protein